MKRVMDGWRDKQMDVTDAAHPHSFRNRPFHRDSQQRDAGGDWLKRVVVVCVEVQVPQRCFFSTGCSVTVRTELLNLDSWQLQTKRLLYEHLHRFYMWKANTPPWVHDCCHQAKSITTETSDDLVFTSHLTSVLFGVKGHENMKLWSSNADCVVFELQFWVISVICDHFNKLFEESLNPCSNSSSRNVKTQQFAAS